ncbi:MAG: translocation protein TolB [Acidobacteria bacterium]|nr:MAG: translocation protein TolB [Acidobacteriota bacterium]
MFFLAVLLSSCGSASAQDRIRMGTGLGQTKIRVALADFGPRYDSAKTHASLFTQVVRDDLQFSGILELASPSFYPTQVPTVPGELKAPAWIAAPTNATYVGFGNLTESTSEVTIQAWLFDVRNPSSPPVVGKVYRGGPTDLQVRKFAHEFADEIISKLTGGLPSVASTQIAFVRSTSPGVKEIWGMDYDGANQHQLTNLRSIAITPRWSPDASRIAFTCYEPYKGLVSAQICMYSLDTSKLIAFPRFPGTNITPAWSPDGTQIIFSSSMQGNPELYVCDVNCNRPKRLTQSSGANMSPSWNPKTGQTIAFVSDRGGTPQLYLVNVDGTGVTKIDMPDKGYVIDPAWSPNGQMLAFSWRRPNDNYDLYIMDPASQQLLELTRDQGRNERPSWAPDGRHLVFESTRSGERQIWTMLADGSQAHQLTTGGHNESPNWSTH